MERIAKFLSRAGVCSRRQAEELVLQGKVEVNNQVITTPATLVGEKDIVVVNKKLIASPDNPLEVTTRVWCYYKPCGYVTTHKDPQGRPTVFSDLKSKGLPRVISVGRLDLNSEGLLLLTNDGSFSRHAELPSTGWARKYLVRVYGEVNAEALQNLQNGITIDGINYGKIDVEILKKPNTNRRDPRDAGSRYSSNSWLAVTLYEGKNREIRKVMNHFGLRVNKLIRQSYGPYDLGSLKPHEFFETKALFIK